MLPIIRYHNYSCGLLEETDIPAFIHFTERRVEEEVSLFALTGYKAERYRELHLSGNNSVTVSPGYPRFCIYHDNQIVGITAITVTGKDDDPNYEFTGSKILPSYRGEHLSRILYDARIRFLLTETDASYATTRVNEENPASNKAALRNGFKFYTRSTDPLAGTYIEYNLDLSELRNEFSDELGLELQ